MKCRKSIPFVDCAVIVVVLFVMTGQASALLVGGPDILLPAPNNVIDDPPGATNTHQQAFNERQGVTLLANLAVDDGVIPAGTVVDSHMIFLNTDGNVTVYDYGVAWTFNGLILGVMSDGTGSLEVASSPILGAVGTTYPAAPFSARGMESDDGYVVSGNTITVDMGVSEPGDWIRVITRSGQVPTISEWGMVAMAALLVVGITVKFGRRRRTAA